MRRLFTRLARLKARTENVILRCARRRKVTSISLDKGTYRVDVESGLVHHVHGTGANVADVTDVAELRHGEENVGLHQCREA